MAFPINTHLIDMQHLFCVNRWRVDKESLALTFLVIRISKNAALDAIDSINKPTDSNGTELISWVSAPLQTLH